MARKDKGGGGGGGNGVGSTQVLLRGDADDLMVDALVTAEKHERRMTKEGRTARNAARERTAASHGENNTSTTTGREEHGEDAPRFGRELVPFFVEGCSGGNLEADVNHDLTDRNQNYNFNGYVGPSQNGAGGGMTARQTMEVVPLPVPSNLIPQSNAQDAQQSTNKATTAKNAKRASKKKTNTIGNGKEQNDQNAGRKGNTVIVQATHPHQSKKSAAPAGPTAPAAPTAAERWAAPSFSNSPKPETIPMPPATLLYPR